MVRGIDAAVAELKEHPDQPVTAEISGLVIELRYRGRRTADDIFKEIGPWEGETYEELRDQMTRETGNGEAKVVPEPRRLGFMAGEITVPADFDRMGEAEIEAF